MSPLPKAPRCRTPAARWLLSLVALAASFVLAELALRALGVPRVDAAFQFVRPDGEVDDVFGRARPFVADPELFWKQAPGPHPPAALINRLGLRGYLPPREKGPRDLRIACVGDSCTFGMGVRYEDVYGMQLERLVQAARPDLCVAAMLIGLPGYSTYQSRVLFDRHAAELAPDVTILYCGAWNDYLPAVGRSDTARARAQGRSSRLLALLDKLAEPSAQQLAFYRDEFRAGRAPCGRRVSVPEFRANIEALLARVRVLRSRAVVVVPPVPAATAKVHSIGAEYRACLRELAVREQVPVLDGEALFAAHAGEPLFLDWVHPTPRGHELLAAALLPLVQSAAPTAVEAPAAMAPAQVDPASVSALAPATLTLTAPGLGDALAFERLFLGTAWQPEVRALDAQRVQVQLLRPLPPGRHTVTLRTARGLVTTGVVLEVAPPAAWSLVATPVRKETGVVLRVSGVAPAETIVSVWLAARRSDVARATPLGALHLAPAEPSASWPEPIALETLPLPRFVTLSDGSGGFALECPVPPELAGAGATVFVQAAVVDPYDRALGALSDVVDALIPK